jgi:hypothetical protein
MSNVPLWAACALAATTWVPLALARGGGLIKAMTLPGSRPHDQFCFFRRDSIVALTYKADGDLAKRLKSVLTPGGAMVRPGVGRTAVRRVDGKGGMSDPVS